MTMSIPPFFNEKTPTLPSEPSLNVPSFINLFTLLFWTEGYSLHSCASLFNTCHIARDYFEVSLTYLDNVQETVSAEVSG